MQRIASRPKRLDLRHREGSAAVEFSLIAPLLIALFMGAVQSGFNFDSTTKLYCAIRQTGRLATLDNADDFLLPGQTLNTKIISDIKNALTADGLPGSSMTVTITHAEGASAGSTFNLSDPATDLKYFKISVTLPYSAINTGNFLPSSLSSLSASVVFRKGANTLIQ